MGPKIKSTGPKIAIKNIKPNSIQLDPRWSATCLKRWMKKKKKKNTHYWGSGITPKTFQILYQVEKQHTHKRRDTIFNVIWPNAYVHGRKTIYTIWTEMKYKEISTTEEETLSLNFTLSHWGSSLSATEGLSVFSLHFPTGFLTSFSALSSSIYTPRREETSQHYPANHSRFTISDSALPRSVPPFLTSLSKLQWCRRKRFSVWSNEAMSSLYEGN